MTNALFITWKASHFGIGSRWCSSVFINVRMEFSLKNKWCGDSQEWSVGISIVDGGQTIFCKCLENKKGTNPRGRTYPLPQHRRGGSWRKFLACWIFYHFWLAVRKDIWEAFTRTFPWWEPCHGHKITKKEAREGAFSASRSWQEVRPVDRIYDHLQACF